MQIKIVNKSSNELPKYEIVGSAGMDLRADIIHVSDKFLFHSYKNYTADGELNCIQVDPGGRCLIPTGLHIQLPLEYEAMVRPRSGLALKYGVTVLNTPGCIDSGYTGDVGVIIINHGIEPFYIYQGDRIAQLIVSKVENVEWDLVETLDETERGGGGFGSTKIQ